MPDFKDIPDDAKFDVKLGKEVVAKFCVACGRFTKGTSAHYSCEHTDPVPQRLVFTGTQPTVEASAPIAAVVPPAPLLVRCEAFESGPLQANDVDDDITVDSAYLAFDAVNESVALDLPESVPFLASESTRSGVTLACSDSWHAGLLDRAPSADLDPSQSSQVVQPMMARDLPTLLMMVCRNVSRGGYRVLTLFLLGALHFVHTVFPPNRLQAAAGHTSSPLSCLGGNGGTNAQGRHFPVSLVCQWSMGQSAGTACRQDVCYYGDLVAHWCQAHPLLLRLAIKYCLQGVDVEDSDHNKIGSTTMEGPSGLLESVQDGHKGLQQTCSQECAFTREGQVDDVLSGLIRHGQPSSIQMFRLFL